ncbi:MAG: hypothetical protein SWO11_22895 [Thermodesulfobacteriota bacterium]|nr:hypothetical protein [Thermodesulfobacteriota bacterium]
MNDIEDALKESLKIYAEKFFQDFEEHNKDRSMPLKNISKTDQLLTPY